jgi:hypothetical protein
MSSELLAAQQGVEQVQADKRRHDQPEDVRGAHIRSIPYTIASNTANMSTPSNTATTSMGTSWLRRGEERVQKPAPAIKML